MAVAEASGGCENFLKASMKFDASVDSSFQKAFPVAYNTVYPW
jgi:hypothetical protein